MKTSIASRNHTVRYLLQLAVVPRLHTPSVLIKREVALPAGYRRVSIEVMAALQMDQALQRELRNLDGNDVSRSLLWPIARFPLQLTL